MSPLLLLLLHLLLQTLSLLSPSSSFPFNVSYRIDCGGPSNLTDPLGDAWLSDRYVTGGSSSVVSEPLIFRLPTEKTLRFFPPTTSGKKNCYLLPLTPNPTSPRRFFFRTFTVYDNYDGKSHPPSFEVSVQGTVVFSYRSPWPESLARDGSYSDLFAFISSSNSQAQVCFYSIATDPPLIASLEALEVDPSSYAANQTQTQTHTHTTLLPKDLSYLLVNYARFSSADDQWGPRFTNDTDPFGRSWQSDSQFRSKSSTGFFPFSTTRTIANADAAPNYFPAKLYQSAVTLTTAHGILEYDLPVDAKSDYLLWFHFAEIDPTVTGPGQRVFDVLINGVNVNRIDVFKEAGAGFSAYDWHYVAKNLSDTTLTVRLAPVAGLPFISALENYAIVPTDLATLPQQVEAMMALKDSLRVPDRMGWNGDPCAPTTWDAWEGVTCQTIKDHNALVVFQIDLSSQGLKGFISDKIGLLKNLATLNLSLNSLEGTLPVGLGEVPLVKLDLSNNKFTGSIPDTLTSSTLRLVLLNDNQLEGPVPEQLYSIGVHGGVIDLSGNKGLCGVPPLPDCPMFWRNGQLSKQGKIGIAVSFVIFFGLATLVIYICIQRRRNDYDFGLPHNMIPFAAKRNKYHRQKSLMILEMESQHAKGLIPNLDSRR